MKKASAAILAALCFAPVGLQAQDAERADFAAGWVTQSDLADLTAQAQPVTSRQLVAREAIRGLFTRYAYALDEVNSDVMRTVFTDDALMSVYFGTTTPYLTTVGAESVASNLAAVAAVQQDQRRHLIGNVDIQNLTSNSADVLAVALVANTVGGETHFTGSVFYSAKVVRGSDRRWRFSDLKIIIDAPAVPAR
jgi:SnoaL-like domain